MFSPFKIVNFLGRTESDVVEGDPDNKDLMPAL